MATLKEVAHTADSGSDEELPTQEEAVEEQSPDRRHVDALLDISEEEFRKVLEPFEQHCYPGWEEAVRGWARVAPLSGILLPQSRCRKPKQADNATPSSVDPTIRDVSSSASIAERRCESHVDPQDSLKKSTAVNQHTGWGNAAVAPLQEDGPERPVLQSMQTTKSNVPHKEGVEEERNVMLRHIPSKYSDSRHTKHQLHGRLNNIVVPIKNVTFLPPIKSLRPNPQKASSQFRSGKQAPDGETIEENGFILEKKSGTRGTRVDNIASPALPTHSAALTSTNRTCQHNPPLFSAVSLSVPKRYQVAASSKPDTVHHTSYSVTKRLTQALHIGTAAGAQARMYPSKTVCM